MATVRRVAALKALWDAVRGASTPGAPGVGERLRALPRMLAMAASGRYPQLSRGRIALLVLGVVYVISPIDAVPEIFLPLIGLADDAVVVAWLAGTVLSETEAFLRWESDRARTILGEVV